MRLRVSLTHHTVAIYCQAGDPIALYDTVLEPDPTETDSFQLDTEQGKLTAPEGWELLVYTDDTDGDD